MVSLYSVSVKLPQLGKIEQDHDLAPIILAIIMAFLLILPLDISWGAEVSGALDIRHEIQAENHERPAFDVWLEHDNKKIWKESLIPKKGKDIFEISAAKNEWEAFQVAIKSHADLKNVEIIASEFSDKKGNRIAAPTIYKQHYIPISKTANKKYGHIGLVPDALVPLINPITGSATGGMYGGKVFELNADELYAFWLDVFIGKDALPGEYLGEITVRAGKEYSKIIPVKLTVFKFSLPDIKHLTATFQLSMGNVIHSHGINNNKTTKDKIMNLSYLYESMLHDHYINNWSPITGYNYGLNGVKVNVKDGKVIVNWSKYDKLISPYMDGTAYADNVPAQTLFVPYWLPVKKKDGQGWAKRATRNNYTRIDYELFGQYIKEVQSHFKEKGWLDRSFVFYFDEPFISKWKYDAFIKTSKVIRENAPELKILITDGYKGKSGYKAKSFITEPIEKYVDVWDPVTYQVSSLDLVEYYRNRKSEGKFDFWCQTLANANPRRAVINLFPEYDMPFHRMWGIMSWDFGFQGIEWWETIVWWDGKNRKRLDPWTNPIAFPGFNQPVNSDGRLFFPGTENAIGGPDIPISSLRMKAIREAIEDYEYLYLLNQLGGIEEFDMNLLHTMDESKSQEMNQPMPMGSGPWQWWEGDGERMMEIRNNIARLIEKRYKH